MKKWLVIALSIACVFMVSCAMADVSLQEAFPDDIFRDYIAELYDVNKDGILTDSEIEDRTYLYCASMGIHSLKGIEYLTPLEDLTCSYNELTDLDVSKNTSLKYLYCGDNALTELKVSANTQLKNLSCANNQISSLDLGNIQTLEYVNVSINKLKTLDLSKQSSLSTLYCQNNELTSIGLPANSELQELECMTNNFTVLDLSGQNNLKTLNCSYNDITTLNLPAEIEELTAYGSKLSSLDLSGCPGLKKVIVNGSNNLTSLNVSNCLNLVKLDCHGCALASLNVRDNQELTDLSCGKNPLTELEIQYNKKLKYLSCTDNNLKKLDLSPLENLEQVSVNWGKLENLVLANKKLSNLSCYGNKSTILDISRCPLLVEVVKNNNQKYGSIWGTYSKWGEGHNSLTVQHGSTITIDGSQKIVCHIVDEKRNRLEPTTEYDGYEEYWICSSCGRRFSDAAGEHEIQSLVIIPKLTTEATPTPTPTPTPKPDIKPTPEPADKVEAFVTRCYSIILGRKPDAAGFADWTKALQDKTKTASEIIYGFVGSNEFKNKNYSCSDVVEILYKAMLGRGSDMKGKEYWVTKLEDGQPVAVVINGFCASNEFQRICREYGITPGSVKVDSTNEAGNSNNGEDNPRILTSARRTIKKEKAEEFVRRCYKLILGREADQSGLDNWVEILTSGQMTPEQVANSFFSSAEFTNRNLDSEPLVKTLYRVYLNRDADQEGLAAWTEKLNNGTTLQELLKSFSKTSEFKAIISSMID